MLSWITSESRKLALPSTLTREVFLTYPAWSQPYYLLGRGLGISSLLAVIPTLLLLYLLAVRRKASWIAALAGLAATLLLAIFAYGMSLRHTISSAAYGAGFGIFPISWIVFWALVLYEITVTTGKFEVIKDSIGSITSDKRMQALLIAFSFGAFIEGCAGFGTPVAVAAAMMVGLGFSSLYASSICPSSRSPASPACPSSASTVSLASAESPAASPRHSRSSCPHTSSWSPAAFPPCSKSGPRSLPAEASSPSPSSSSPTSSARNSPTSSRPSVQ
jgi:hypothetical protein